LNTCQEQSQSNGITNAPSQAPKQVDNSFAPIHSKLYRIKGENYEPEIPQYNHMGTAGI
jgi:hypothetical protein